MYDLLFIFITIYRLSFFFFYFSFLTNPWKLRQLRGFLTEGEGTVGLNTCVC